MNSAQELCIPAPASITSSDVFAAWDEKQALLDISRVRTLASKKLLLLNANNINALFVRYSLEPQDAFFWRYQHAIQPIRVALEESRIHEEDEHWEETHDAFIAMQQSLGQLDGELAFLARDILVQEVKTQFPWIYPSVFDQLPHWALEAVNVFNPDQSPDPVERLSFGLNGFGLTFKAYVLSRMLVGLDDATFDAMITTSGLEDEFRALLSIPSSCYGHIE